MSDATTNSEFVAAANTPEWYAARNSGIGASEIAAVCGLSQYQTPLHVYERKVGHLPEEDESDAMRRGKLLEPVVIAEWCHETGGEVIQAPVPMLRHPEHPWRLATLDATVRYRTPYEALECKSANWRLKDQWGDVESDEVPTEYLCQCQWQMHVTSIDVCNLAVLFSAEEFRTYRIERNDSFIEELARAASEFWRRVELRDPPEPSWDHDRTPELVNLLHGTVSDGVIVDLTDTSRDSWAQYEALGQQIREFEKQRSELKARVLHEIGDHSGGDLGDGRFVRRKVTLRKGYTVEPTEYVDVRAVKLKK